MTSTEFVIKELEKLVAQMPTLKVSYEFDIVDNSHVIEILPKEIYESDETYMALEIAFDTAFSKLYPFEGILFISDGSLTKVITPLYEETGNLYERPSNLIDSIARLLSKYLPEFENFAYSENNTINFSDIKDMKIFSNMPIQIVLVDDEKEMSHCYGNSQQPYSYAA